LEPFSSNATSDGFLRKQARREEPCFIDAVVPTPIKHVTFSGVNISRIEVRRGKMIVFLSCVSKLFFA
jgi:hypothetical protein